MNKSKNFVLLTITFLLLSCENNNNTVLTTKPTQAPVITPEITSTPKITPNSISPVATVVPSTTPLPTSTPVPTSQQTPYLGQTGYAGYAPEPPPTHSPNYTENTVVTTLAGSTLGFNDGTGSDAQFNNPTGVAVDSSGNVYVTDENNNKIRKITSVGVVSTFAGSGGFGGFADGTGSNAQFNNPRGIAVDSSGNIFVADNYKIRKITPAGVVSTLAGSTDGFANGTGTNAQFGDLFGIAVDNLGNIFVADNYNQKIRKITPSGVVSTLAGSGYLDPNYAGNGGFADGTASNAQFNRPSGVAVDSSGNVYVADTSNHKIRKITPSGVVSTLAGSAGGFADGTGTKAQFSFPYGVTVDSSGNVFVADTVNNIIRKITPAGVVSSLAGSAGGFADGTGSNAKFGNPVGIGLDSSNNVYVADTQNHKIRKIIKQ